MGSREMCTRFRRVMDQMSLSRPTTKPDERGVRVPTDVGVSVVVVTR